LRGHRQRAQSVEFAADYDGVVVLADRYARVADPAALLPGTPGST
jgi:hypothetical protein